MTTTSSVRIGYDRHEALLKAHADRIVPLVEQALLERAPHVVAVVDPASTIAAIASSAVGWTQIEVAFAKMGVADAIRLIEMFALAVVDDGVELPVVRGILDELRSPFPENCTYVVTFADYAVSLIQVGVRVGPRSPRVPHAIKDADGETLVNAAGCLRILYDVDLGDVREDENRERLRRLKERVDAAMATESIRATPRPLDEVIWSSLDGPAFDRDLRAIGEKRALDRLFERCSRRPS